MNHFLLTNRKLLANYENEETPTGLPLTEAEILSVVKKKEERTTKVHIWTVMHDKKRND